VYILIARADPIQTIWIKTIEVVNATDLATGGEKISMCMVKREAININHTNDLMTRL
jgi:hypothetical protein